ncbi:dienelactone hydrolase family protein [Diaphorobacter sp. HDW4A]|uniref:dienelactone hydrolase family protein n=1 Tax=Diaphorobacter sp. HDW4A TaxID=2714924 RepID=UPI001F0E85F3|nr:dienelactone hydrolase family protein [Diaphorobacter sp. HDW4A]
MLRTHLNRLFTPVIIFFAGVLSTSGIASAQSVADLFPSLPAMPQMAPMAPATVLLSDTQGNIRFNSSSPYDLDVLLHQPTKAAPTAGMGRLLLPPQASDATPVPAMVILPGGSGVMPGREGEMAQMLIRNGIAALVVDYYQPRGINDDTPYRIKLLGASEFDVMADAYAALRALNRHPAIDARRIGLIGYSRGGMVARMSMDERMRAKLAPRVPPFALHVDFYGPCFEELRTQKTTGAPLLSFRSGEDASNDLVACATAESRLRKAGSLVNAVVFAKAGHDWDSSEPRTVAERPYLRGCTVKFDANAIPSVRGHALIPANAKPDRETRIKLRAQSGKLLGDCVKIGYVSGRDDEVKSASQSVLMHFLTSQMGAGD